jgi:hypothetical protein
MIGSAHNDLNAPTSSTRRQRIKIHRWLMPAVGFDRFSNTSSLVDHMRELAWRQESQDRANLWSL